MDSNSAESDYFSRVVVHRSLVTHKLCNEIVAEAERLGFQNEFESIDQDFYDIKENQSSQYLHLYENGSYYLQPYGQAFYQLYQNLLILFTNIMDQRQ